MASILIVDDESSYREAAQVYFELAGWTVFSARDGTEAIELLDERAAEVDGIVLDRSMPGVSGDAVLTWLYNHQLLGDICVVMLTAYGDLDSAVNALSMGAWQYVQKPLDLQTVRSLLAPGIALKKCHKIRRELLVADDLPSFLERLRSIVNETLAPDSFQIMFITSGTSIDLPGEADPVFDRRFVSKIRDGARFISVNEPGMIKDFDPVLSDARSLMAVPVRAQDRIVGILEMESRTENGFDARWQEVLLYVADLVGLWQTITTFSRRKAEAEQLALVNRELRHCLATSVNILGMQTREVARQLQVQQRNPELIERVAIIERHVNAIHSVMDELRQFANQLSHFEVRHDEVSLNQVVSRVLVEFRGIAAEVGTSLTENQDTIPITVYGDERWIEYCLQCLVQNAIEAIQERRRIDSSGTEGPGSVRVTVRAEEEWVRIEVADTGVGFDDEVCKRLFVPLFSTKSRVRSGGKNEGIGLYTAKRMVEEQGGVIEAHSAGALQGATFCVVLPRTQVNRKKRERGL